MIAELDSLKFSRFLEKKWKISHEKNTIMHYAFTVNSVIENNDRHN